MDEIKNFEANFEDGQLKMHVNSNRDGEKLLSVKVDLNEGLQEILKRGDKLEGAKLVGFEFAFDKIKIQLDTDQDGEKLLELELSLAEALDESGLMEKISA